jgi:hypothetical protein
MKSGSAIIVLPRWRSGWTIKQHDRIVNMLKQELILRNPLRHFGFETEDIIPLGGFGAVLAPAGEGKTALLVQLALNAMLRNRNVLHVSLSDPVNKVTLWYGELFSHLASQHKGAHISQLWDSVLQHRFIMTFRVESFSVPKLEERMNDLTEQGIFEPDMMIIDGLHCDATMRTALEALKAKAKNKMYVWFAVHTRHDEKPGPDGLSPAFAPVADLFDLVLKLRTIQADVRISLLKGAVAADPGRVLLLDPSTMLIKDQSLPGSADASR